MRSSFGAPLPHWSHSTTFFSMDPRFIPLRLAIFLSPSDEIPTYITIRVPHRVLELKDSCLALLGLMRWDPSTLGLLNQRQRANRTIGYWEPFDVENGLIGLTEGRLRRLTPIRHYSAREIGLDEHWSVAKSCLYHESANHPACSYQPRGDTCAICMTSAQDRICLDYFCLIGVKNPSPL